MSLFEQEIYNQNKVASKGDIRIVENRLVQSAENDSANNNEYFYLDMNPEEWFVASRRIERLREKEEALFSQYGIQDESHFLRLRDAWRDYQGRLATNEGGQPWRELLQRCAYAETAALREQDHAILMVTNPHMLEPIEGISIQDYGRIAARTTAGQNLAAVLMNYGMGEARYHRVAEAWNQRMALDTTFTLAEEYRKAFRSASTSTLN